VSVTPRYAPIPIWCQISGMGRSVTYEELGRRNLKAIKLGSRTLIDVEHGLDWLASMPTAEITTGRSRRQAPSAADPTPRRGPPPQQPLRRDRLKNADASADRSPADAAVTANPTPRRSRRPEARS
jgi:hypothetical protein